MRLLAAFSVVSATGALANSAMAMAMADSSSASTSHVMAMEASSSTMMAHKTKTSSAMMHGATAGSAMMQNATASATMIHNTSAMAMAQETTSTAMMHVTTSMAAMYTASVAPAMINEGPVTHTVTVGGTAGLVYTPNQVMAAVNDIVHFVFMSQNHTATQSSFAKPCNKLAADAPDSGFMLNPNNTVVPAPNFDYTVTSTDPTWWYCKQRTGTHCGKGMVFAINPTVDKSFDAFKMAAISINGTVATSTSVAAVSATAVGTVTLIAGSMAATTNAAAGTTDAAATASAAGTTDAAATASAAETTNAAATASAAPIVAGWNEGGASCQCACFCGVAAYPQGDGVGAYGGYGGSLPAPW